MKSSDSFYVILLTLWCCMCNISSYGEQRKDSTSNQHTFHIYPIAIKPSIRHTQISSDSYSYDFTDNNGNYQIQGEKTLPKGNYFLGAEMNFFAFDMRRFKCYFINVDYFWRSQLRNKSNMTTVSMGFSYQIPLKNKLSLEPVLFFGHTWLRDHITKYNVEPGAPILEYKNHRSPNKDYNNTQGYFDIDLLSTQWVLKPQLILNYEINSFLIANLILGYNIGMRSKSDRVQFSWNDSEELDEGEFFEVPINDLKVSNNQNQVLDKIPFNPNRLQMSIGIGIRLKAVKGDMIP